MSKPTISIFDVTTQEQVIREMNDEEYAAHLITLQEIEKLQEERAVAEAAAEAKKAAKAQALAALGLSQEVVNLLAE